MTNPEPAVKRDPVSTIFTALNPAFLTKMAMIAKYASEKYGSWDQYTKARLDGEKSCVSHALGHLMKYQSQETYDHFDGDVRWHLVAVAYNAMMQFYYHTVFGPEPTPWEPEEGPIECVDADEEPIPYTPIGAGTEGARPTPRRGKSGRK